MRTFIAEVRAAMARRRAGFVTRSQPGPGASTLCATPSRRRRTLTTCRRARDAAAPGAKQPPRRALTARSAWPLPGQRRPRRHRQCPIHARARMQVSAQSSSATCLSPNSRIAVSSNVRPSGGIGARACFARLRGGRRGACWRPDPRRLASTPGWSVARQTGHRRLRQGRCWWDERRSVCGDRQHPSRTARRTRALRPSRFQVSPNASSTAAAQLPVQIDHSRRRRPFSGL